MSHARVRLRRVEIVRRAARPLGRDAQSEQMTIEALTWTTGIIIILIGSAFFLALIAKVKWHFSITRFWFHAEHKTGAGGTVPITWSFVKCSIPLYPLFSQPFLDIPPLSLSLPSLTHARFLHEIRVDGTALRNERLRIRALQ